MSFSPDLPRLWNHILSCVRFASVRPGASKPTCSLSLSFNGSLFSKALFLEQSHVCNQPLFFFAMILFFNGSLFQPLSFSTARCRPSDGLVSFRSKSMKAVYAGPVLVSDGGSNRNRFVRSQRDFFFFFVKQPADALTSLE